MIYNLHHLACRCQFLMCVCCLSSCFRLLSVLWSCDWDFCSPLGSWTFLMLPWLTSSFISFFQMALFVEGLLTYNLSPITLLQILPRRKVMFIISVHIFRRAAVSFRSKWMLLFWKDSFCDNEFIFTDGLFSENSVWDSRLSLSSISGIHTIWLEHIQINIYRLLGLRADLLLLWHKWLVRNRRFTTFLRGISSFLVSQLPQHLLYHTLLYLIRVLLPSLSWAMPCFALSLLLRLNRAQLRLGFFALPSACLLMCLNSSHSDVLVA